MSSKSNRRKRRQNKDTPMLVERVQRSAQEETGKTYEEANWARLSPLFREAHNRKLQARGLPTIPPPLVDLYVKPPQPVIRPFDPSDKEVIEAIATARRFEGPIMMGPGDEGFNSAALHPTIGRQKKR